MAVFFPELWCVDDLFEGGYFVIVVIDLYQLFFTFDDAIVAFRLYQGLFTLCLEYDVWTL